jgi:HEAT repeat protein
VSDLTEHELHATIAQLGTAPCLKPVDIDFLIDHLGYPRKAVQKHAAQALAAAAQRGAPLQEPLAAVLANPTATTLARRWGAVYALSLLGPPPAAALGTLIEVLDCRDGDLRWAAAEILIRMDDRARPQLLCLAADGTAAQRKMALYCLRSLGASGLAEYRAAHAALNDSEPAVRLAALSALVRLAVDRHAAAQAVLPLVADPDEGVRRAAIRALGVVGERSPEIARLLAEAAHNRADPGLRRAAEGALRAIERSSKEKAKR